MSQGRARCGSTPRRKTTVLATPRFCGPIKGALGLGQLRFGPRTCSHSGLTGASNGGATGTSPAHVTRPATSPAVCGSNCVEASTGGAAGGAGGESASQPVSAAASKAAPQLHNDRLRSFTKAPLDGGRAGGGRHRSAWRNPIFLYPTSSRRGNTE